MMKKFWFWVNKKNQPSQSSPPENDPIFPQKSKPKLPLVERSIWGKSLWDWLELVGGFSVIATAASFVFNSYNEKNKESQRYYQGLVSDYIKFASDSLSSLDDTKDSNLKIEKVQKLVSTKAQNILINVDKDFQQTANLINFLRKMGIGFVGYERRFQPSTPQNICSEDSVEFINPHKTTDFSRFLCSADLVKVKLNKHDLSFIVLEKSRLYKAELQEVNLVNADLEGANLSESKLMGADLTYANLRGASLTSANLENTVLNRVNLTGANLNSESEKFDPVIGSLFSTPKTILINATIGDANLMNASLNKVNLSGANFQPMGLKLEKSYKEKFKIDIPEKRVIIPVNLRNADLSETNLSSADLTMANLRGANLEGATIDYKTQFNYAIYDQYTCFSSYTFPKFKQQLIPFLHLKLVKLDSLWGWIESLLNEVLSLFNRPALPTDFNPSKYEMLFIRTLDEDVSLRKKYDPSNCEDKLNLKAKPTTLDLSRADLRGADLRDSDLHNVNLSGAKLRGADLRGADLIGAQVDKEANLTDAIYDDKTKLPFTDKEAKNRKIWKIVPGADLDGADLSGQDLTGVDLHGSQLKHTHLVNVQLDHRTNLEGAIYNQYTRLPFSNTEASKRKMVYTPYPE